MQLKKILYVSLLCLLFVGCAEPLASDKLNYAGHWMSADSSINLTITPEGRVEYEKILPGKSTSLSAPIKSFDGDSFTAGVGPLSTEFKVTQAPHQDAQGNWFIVVDGHILSKRS